MILFVYMKQYKFILLDWDGCLAKTLDIHLQSYEKTFAEYGIYPEDREITQKVFGDWNGPKKLGITDIDTYTKKYLNRVNKAYPTVGLYEDVFETLTVLKNMEKKLALITTSLKSTVQPALANNNLTNMFDVFLGSEDVIKHKPDPEIIFKALDLLNGEKNQAIIIGDSKSDLGAASNAGIDSLLFFPEYNKAFYDLKVLKTYNPTYVVTDFKEVLKIIV